MKAKPQNTYKHLLKVVSKTNTRPVLKGFHVNQHYVEATDSHRLLRVYSEESYGFEGVVDPRTLQPINQKYPGTNRLIPTTYQTRFLIQTDSTLPKLLSLSKAAPKNETLKLSVRKNGVQVVSSEAGILSEALPHQSFEGEDVDIHVNASFFTDALVFLADQDSETVSVGLNGSLKPFLFHVDNAFAYLLTPLRVAS